MVPEHVAEAETMKSERGVQFLVGSSFYREESAVGRDLACLAAAVYKKEKGRLHVLDALSGSGVRAARYLAHSQADFVWANDACVNLDPLIAHNLSLASTSAAASKTVHNLLPSIKFKFMRAIPVVICSAVLSSFHY
jgi:tRNA G26 N,N-dimethylase Trm1